MVRGQPLTLQCSADARRGRVRIGMKHSPLTMSMVKRVLNRAYEVPLAAGLELEGLAYGFLRTTHDFREGVAAFVEGRSPEYTGG